MKRWLKRLLCCHVWIKNFPTFSNLGLFAAQMRMTTWFCPKCGKEIVRERGEIPISYIESRN